MRFSFAFVRVARVRRGERSWGVGRGDGRGKRGRDRGGGGVSNRFGWGNEGMEKREDDMEVRGGRGGGTSGSHVPVTVLQVYKKRNFRLS